VINTVLLSVFGGFALILGLLGLVQKPLRLRAWSAAACAAAAALAAQNDAFWTLALMGVCSLWLAFLTVPWGDTGWRARFGLVSSVGMVAFLLLWPTLHDMTQGRIPCPPWVQEHVKARLVAGLDLRGGMRLVYTVDVAEAVKDKRDSYYEDMRRELAKLYADHEGDEAPSDQTLSLLRERVDLKAPRAQTDTILLFVKEGQDPSKIDQRFRNLFKPDLEMRKVDDRHFEFSIRQAAENSIRQRAVEQAKDIVLRRVDSKGLKEASVSTRDDDIIVEVPGQDEASFNEIRELISQTARLEFKLLDDGSGFFAELEKTVDKESLPEGLEFNQYSYPAGQNEKGENLSGADVQVFLPKLEAETPQENYLRLREWASTLTPPPDREIGFQVVRQIVDPATQKEEETGYRAFILKERAEITGDMIRDAQAAPDQGQTSLGGWVVNLRFSDKGGSLFEKITGANINRRFAIVLDGKVESTPNILDRIAGGSSRITMGAADPQVQLQDAKQLELVLRSGALPAPITPSNEQLIGPSLGKDSIRLGVEGAAAGGLLVLLFMILYYRRAGLIADISVLMNLFLQLAILASFGASMTLPGIAGLALTLGMSVDANVLINERIREELRDGKSARAAVDLGYSKALSAIIDGQLTTLISGVVLAQYGTGPIKGFAFTLMVGVACSVFSGVVVSRVLFDIWVRSAGKNKSIYLG
jgi:preprotein translocase subunit SecD